MRLPRPVLARILGAVCVLWMTAAQLPAGTSNSLLDISADGSLLVCANRDNGTVTILELPSLGKRHEIEVGHKPEGVSFIGPGHTVAVAVYADDRVALVDADAGKKLGEIEVFDEPYGVVSTSDGARLFVTLEYPGEICEIDPQAQKIVRTIPAGSMLRGIALDEARRRIYVTEYLTGVVRAVDLERASVVQEWIGSSSNNLARNVVLHPTRPKAYVSHIRSRIAVAEGSGSIFPILSVLDTQPAESGKTAKRTAIPLDSFVGNFVVANPWEAAVAPDGKRAYLVFAGTDDMYICDVLDDDYRELEFVRIQNLGHNPRAVRVSADSQAFYVYNTLDFEVVAYDADSFKVKQRTKVCDNPHSAEVLQGKILFYSALQPMTGPRWISCASCHPDGDGDGRTWQNPEGLRNTTALFGMAWTHPIHWSADRDEVQDFEHTVRGRLMQGRGLISGDVQPALDKPNKGLSKALDAVAAYSNGHYCLLSPHSKKGLSVAAKRGKELFFAKETGCATCHTGPFFTDSTPQRPYKLHDVGTGGDDASEKMGPKYDTPTLLGIYRTAPYLHHGRAATLRDVLTTANPDDKHGRTSHLTPEQVNDLVEFLKALPYEDPEPAAQAAGLTKVER